MFHFLGIGAQKAGTTWLFEMLKQHRDISFPLGKEVHYWNNQYPHKPPQDYFSKFNNQTLFEGEITPAYALLSEEVIQIIHYYQPQLKIIYIIRNPIERAWSSAKMALERAEMDLQDASDQWFIDHFNSKNSLRRGDYETCIKTWLKVFPEENFLIIPFEDIKNSPELVLDRACNHIGIRKLTRSTFNKIDLKKTIFPSLKHPLNDNLYQVLHLLYQAKIKSLSLYINKDLSTWI